MAPGPGAEALLLVALEATQGKITNRWQGIGSWTETCIWAVWSTHVLYTHDTDCKLELVHALFPGGL